MKSKIISFFGKSPSNWTFWLILAFVFKLAFFLLGILTRTHETIQIHGFWGNTDADTAGYLLPVENLIHHGNYAPDFRTPGYAVIYLLLSIIFSKAVVCNLLIVIQLILSALSVYAIGLIAKFIFKKDIYFYGTFFLYAISCYACNYDTWLMTESLTTSFLIFSVYYIVKHHESPKNLYLFLSGLFLTWSIFCRPVLIPFLLFFLIFLVLKSSKKGITCLLFLLPFVVSDSLWINHNYQKYNAFYPLLNQDYNNRYPLFSQKYNSSVSFFEDTNSFGKRYSVVEPFVRYGQAWGAPYIFEPNNMISQKWNERTGKTDLVVNVNEIPAYSYTTKFNKDSLIELDKLKDSIQSNRSLLKVTAEYSVLNNKITDYITSLREDKPMVYFIVAPLVLLRRFVINSGSPVLFDRPASSLNKAAVLLKIFFAILYYVVIIFAILGLILMIRTIFKFRSLEFLIMGSTLYIILVHPFILRFCCTRYLVPAYPFMVMCAVVGMVSMYDKVLQRIIRGKV